MHSLSVVQLVEKLLLFESKKLEIRVGQLTVALVQSSITYEQFAPQTNYAYLWKAECCSSPKLCLVY
jgi:hypothetical protein